MSNERLACVLKIAAVDALMFAGVIGVLLDVVSYAETRPPMPMFGRFSQWGVLIFGAGFFLRICIKLVTRR